AWSQPTSRYWIALCSTAIRAHHKLTCGTQHTPVLGRLRRRRHIGEQIYSGTSRTGNRYFVYAQNTEEIGLYRICGSENEFGVPSTCAFRTFHNRNLVPIGQQELARTIGCISYPSYRVIP